MGNTSIASKFSTIAVIMVAIGVALIQGKVFAEGNETEAPVGATQSMTSSLTGNPTATQSQPSNDVKTINLPGAGQGGEDDDEDFGEDDDNFGED